MRKKTLRERVNSGIDTIGLPTSRRNRIISTEKRMREMLKRGRTHTREADDEIREFVATITKANMRQGGWPNTPDGSSSTLLIRGLNAFIEDESPWEEMNSKQLHKRLTDMETAIRKTAYEYFVEPRPGGMADSIRVMREAIESADTDDLELLLAVMISALRDSINVLEPDPGAMVFLEFLTGFSVADR